MDSATNLWMYLNKTDGTLHIPLIYVVIPVGIICVLLLVCCCYCSIKACCEEPEVRFVPRSLPTLPARNNTADIVRTPDSERATRSVEVTDSDEEPSGTCVELDENVVNQVHAMYAKRNYRVNN